MKYRTCIGCMVAAAVIVPAIQAQDAVTPASGQKTLAATMNVYVFPKTGQTSEQQSTDEAACYDWAEQNTGTDPFHLQKQAQVQQGQAEQAAAAAGAAGTGAGARGAVRGAAAGALIGEIASDDPGKGAAYGAGAGLLVGHRRKRIARHEAQAQVQATSVQVQQATATELENFKKAFSVCLEAKDYLAKY